MHLVNYFLTDAAKMLEIGTIVLKSFKKPSRICAMRPSTANLPRRVCRKRYILEKVFTAGTGFSRVNTLRRTAQELSAAFDGVKDPADKAKVMIWVGLHAPTWGSLGLPVQIHPERCRSWPSVIPASRRCGWRRCRSPRLHCKGSQQALTQDGMVHKAFRPPAPPPSSNPRSPTG